MTMQKPVILKTIYEPGITDSKQRMYPRGQISGKVQEVRITTMGVSLVDALWNLCTDFFIIWRSVCWERQGRGGKKTMERQFNRGKKEGGRHGKAPGSL